MTLQMAGLLPDGRKDCSNPKGKKPNTLKSAFSRRAAIACWKRIDIWLHPMKLPHPMELPPTTAPTQTMGEVRDPAHAAQGCGRPQLAQSAIDVLAHASC